MAGPVRAGHGLDASRRYVSFVDRHVLHTLGPARGQRIEHGDVQDDRGQRPQRIGAVTREPELYEDVQGDEHRCPPSPSLGAEE